MLHVIFTEDGIPGHFSDDPRPGSVPVEGLDREFLIAHRRTVKGKWIPRDPVIPLALLPEDIAARQRAEHEAALADRDAAVRDALAREADPLFFRYQRGEVTREDWLAKVAEVKARHPKPSLG
jgi:hypothetical protein